MLPMFKPTSNPIRLQFKAERLSPGAIYNTPRLFNSDMVFARHLFIYSSPASIQDRRLSKEELYRVHKRRDGIASGHINRRLTSIRGHKRRPLYRIQFPLIAPIKNSSKLNQYEIWPWKRKWTKTNQLISTSTLDAQQHGELRRTNFHRNLDDKIGKR